MDRNQDEITDMIIELSEMIREDAFFAISISDQQYHMKALGLSGDISDAIASAMFADDNVADMIRDALQKYTNALN